MSARVNYYEHADLELFPIQPRGIKYWVSVQTVLMMHELCGPPTNEQAIRDALAFLAEHADLIEYPEDYA